MCIWGLRKRLCRPHRTIDLHITFDGVNAVINWFWGHPFHRKFLCIRSTVHVLVDFSHQTKVWHFDSVITANQNITRCKVTMNEAFLCEMILKKIWNNWEHNLFIEKTILILFSLLWVTYSNLSKEFEITNKQGTQDPSRPQFQMISKYSRSSCGDKHFKNMHLMNLTLRMLVNAHVCIKYCTKHWLAYETSSSKL